MGPVGSSPLTRGKLAVNTITKARAGLIPAHAGKTKLEGTDVNFDSAHPRSRGENDIRHAQSSSFFGSSPLTRGKLVPACETVQFAGLIPAHAGKTHGVVRTYMSESAHPRSRGENPRPVSPPEPGWGSSPLTRGKHFLTCAFTAQIDQILETLELAVSFGSYSVWVACATDAPQDQVRSIGLVLPSSRGAS